MSYSACKYTTFSSIQQAFYTKSMLFYYVFHLMTIHHALRIESSRFRYTYIFMTQLLFLRKFAPSKQDEYEEVPIRH